MITGVPLLYEPSEQYVLTINVADSLTLSGGDGNTRAGFMLSSDGIGSFTWDDGQDLRQADGREADVSHSEPSSDGNWQVTWTG